MDKGISKIRQLADLSILNVFLLAPTPTPTRKRSAYNTYVVILSPENTSGTNSYIPNNTPATKKNNMITVFFILTRFEKYPIHNITDKYTPKRC